MERIIHEKNDAKAWFSQEMRLELFSLFNLVNEALLAMNENLSHEYRPGILAKATEKEIKINELHNKLVHSNKLRVESGEYNYKQIGYFNELLNHCEKLADFVINVDKAIARNAK